MKYLLMILCFFMADTFSQDNSAARKPNIIIILVDDMGYSSLGSFGGEIDTPNLDNIAQAGTRFRQFYNCAKCVSTRISIMSGQYEGRAGGRKFRNSVTMGEAMQTAGYRTIAVGKWHLDEEKDPTHYGFDRHFGHLNGAANFFLGNEHFYKNGKPFKNFPKDFYATDAFTDFAIETINEDTEKPFLLYLAYNAPHSPLHCKKPDFEKYIDVYTKGWDEIRKERYRKQIKMGIIDPQWTLSKRPDFIPSWNSLCAEEKKTQAYLMAAYAGMVDNIDQNVGRLINHLKKSGRWKNTLFLFLSDNGASPYTNPSFKNKVADDPENRMNVGVAWANADNTPFSRFKQNQHEGGISTGAILHYPELTNKSKGKILNEPLHVMDVLPTLLDLVGSSYPTTFPGREIVAPSGRSFIPILQGKTLPQRELFFQYMDNRALRNGDWKLVSARSGAWELYNIKEDRTETKNLAAKFPEKVEAMKKRWYEMTKSVSKVSGKYMKPVKSEPTQWGKTKRELIPGEIHKMGQGKKK